MRLKIVFGKNNGVMYFCRNGTWSNEFFNDHLGNWIDTAIERKPKDWQILFDGEVIKNEPSKITH